MASFMEALFRLLARFPLPVLHNLGSMAGWLAYFFSSSYRRHLRENLAQADFSALRGGAIAQAGKLVLELPALWLRSDAVERWVVAVEGREWVDTAMQEGRGMVVLTPHLGCFEIAAQYCATLGPMTALYRPSRQVWLDPLIKRGRGAHFRLAPANLGGVRKLLKALKANEMVFVLPDQAPGEGEGVWAPFFGRPADTMTLAARLAQSGASVIFVYAERLAYGAGYTLHFSPPSGAIAAPGDINREIEALIRACPEQYLWGYNRYKQRRGESCG